MSSSSGDVDIGKRPIETGLHVDDIRRPGSDDAELQHPGDVVAIAALSHEAGDCDDVVEGEFGMPPLDSGKAQADRIGISVLCAPLRFEREDDVIAAGSQEFADAGTECARRSATGR